LNICAILVSVLLLFLAFAEAETVIHLNAIGHRDFRYAKKVLPNVYQQDLERDFYCDCSYSGKEIDLKSCGYVPRKQIVRAKRLEWEHIVPAWVLGHQRACWQKKINGKLGGRRNCTHNDPIFARAEGDLINLVPSIGEINGDRQNFRYSIWSSNPTPIYGQCQTIIDFKNKRIQPRKEIRGRIARIQFYMAEQYGIRLTREDKRIFCAWAREYPVDSWEFERDKRIQKIQGNSNHYVTEALATGKVCD